MVKKEKEKEEEEEPRRQRGRKGTERGAGACPGGRPREEAVPLTKDRRDFVPISTKTGL